MNINELKQKAKAASPTDIQVQTATHRLGSGSVIVCHIYPEGDTYFRILREGNKAMGISYVEASALLSHDARGK